METPASDEEGGGGKHGKRHGAACQLHTRRHRGRCTSRPARCRFWQARAGTSAATWARGAQRWRSRRVMRPLRRRRSKSRHAAAPCTSSPPFTPHTHLLGRALCSGASPPNGLGRPRARRSLLMRPQRVAVAASGAVVGAIARTGGEGAPLALELSSPCHPRTISLSSPRSISLPSPYPLSACSPCSVAPSALRPNTVTGHPRQPSTSRPPQRQQLVPPSPRLGRKQHEPSDQSAYGVASA